MLLIRHFNLSIDFSFVHTLKNVVTFALSELVIFRPIGFIGCDSTALDSQKYTGPLSVRAVFDS